MKQLSLEQIVNCGVERETAIAILPQVERWLAALPAMECWQQLTRHILKPDCPIALHELLYETTFSDWDASQKPAPAWFPSQEEIESTNIAALMHQLQIASYREFHAWSVQNRDRFWEMTIQRLGIRFRQKYTQIVDLSRGVEFPQWLVNARFNIVESCFQAPEDSPAIVFQQDGGLLSTMTYGELHALTNRVANGLVDWGFRPGDAIAIAMPMTAESVAIYLGIIKAGCVVVSIADSFAANEIAIRLRITQAKAIFTKDYIQRASKQLPLYSKIVDADAPKAVVLSLDTSVSGTLRSSDLAWQEFLSSNERFDAVATAPEAYTNILFSSGTTGEPKAIPWTQTTPLKCAVDGHLHQDIHPGDVVAWSTNLGWMMGPWLIYASLINQATIALYYDAPTERGFGQFIQAARVNMLGVVPSLVSIWKTTVCMQGLDWSAIKAFSSTGECSNPQDMLFLMSLAGYKPIIEYCGGTEIGGAYITGTLVQPAAPATFTTPALGLDFIILDAGDRPTNKGELFIIPPSIGLSTTLLNKDHHHVYFADTPSLPSAVRAGLPDQFVNQPINSPENPPLLPSAVRAGLPDQFVNQPINSPENPPLLSLRRHGDWIECLPNGYYRACGRVDDTMNLGGIKVSAAEIEQVLNYVSGIYQTAAIAASPPEGGPSQLVIFAVVAPDRQQDKATLKTQLQKAIASQLNPLFKIYDLAIVDALPRTASNKVMRRALRDRWQSLISAAT
ncbi:MAG: Acetyl-coenzyme A synthetase [Chroococcidiopsis sp. SAG 2025]|uniref:AMP-binding protein n=1 Tax=Chroococcidiopsis sp. SAG 2025 TaxID=171389 RepID=UPI00293742ED|nr:AMP-binding protein [Chroococcidiopsis sp. SAG 2025]MDV2993749.1 Acetyl-coenzyme A synthetase [Chroococcidiopsis sp. SAG 2025]